jgi:hypothetical protein
MMHWIGSGADEELTYNGGTIASGELMALALFDHGDLILL